MTINMKDYTYYEVIDTMKTNFTKEFTMRNNTHSKPLQNAS